MEDNAYWIRFFSIAGATLVLLTASCGYNINKENKIFVDAGFTQCINMATHAPYWSRSCNGMEPVSTR